MFSLVNGENTQTQAHKILKHTISFMVTANTDLLAKVHMVKNRQIVHSSYSCAHYLVHRRKVRGSQCAVISRKTSRFQKRYYSQLPGSNLEEKIDNSSQQFDRQESLSLCQWSSNVSFHSFHNALLAVIFWQLELIETDRLKRIIFPKHTFPGKFLSSEKIRNGPLFWPWAWLPLHFNWNVVRPLSNIWSEMSFFTIDYHSIMSHDILLTCMNIQRICYK